MWRGICATKQGLSLRWSPTRSPSPPKIFSSNFLPSFEEIAPSRRAPPISLFPTFTLSGLPLPWAIIFTYASPILAVDWEYLLIPIVKLLLQVVYNRDFSISCYGLFWHPNMSWVPSKSTATDSWEGISAKQDSDVSTTSIYILLAFIAFSSLIFAFFRSQNL